MGDLVPTGPHSGNLHASGVGVGHTEPLGFHPDAGPLRRSVAWVCPRVTPGEGVAANKGPIQLWGWGGGGVGGGTGRALAEGRVGVC